MKFQKPCAKFANLIILCKIYNNHFQFMETNVLDILLYLYILCKKMLPWPRKCVVGNANLHTAAF